jgi:putative ABC transport system permease protein
VRWWGRLVHRRQLEAQLDVELRDHFERAVADRMAAGMPEEEARRVVRLEFGGLEQIKEECRDARGTRWLEDFAQDLRYGARLLRKSPAFTAVAVLSLALGIGANTAIFSLLDRLLLKTLPVRDPAGLALLDRGSWSNAVWEDIRDRHAHLFQGALAWGDQRFDLAASGQADPAQGLWVSGGFFEVLGVPALLGRTLTAADDQRGGGPDGPVAVISYAFWQRRFGGAADVIGRTLVIDRVVLRVVGVTPPGFFGPAVGRSFDLAVPLATEALYHGERSWLDNRSTWELEIIVRLRPGQTVEQATNALRAVQPQIAEASRPLIGRPRDRAEHLTRSLTLVPAAAGPANLRTLYQKPLLTVMVVVVLVLLIACANIANLLLARASGRQHEFSMRLALGASRLRLARLLLAESLLLAAAGAALGLVFAHWSSRLLVAQLSTPREIVALELSLDLRVLGFTAVVAVGTALLFGIAPAFRAGRARASDALKEQSRSLAGEKRRRLGNPLVAAQVALSLVLVVAAGLFVRTFASLATQDFGFDRDPILLVDVESKRVEIPSAERTALFGRVQAAVEALPGVARAGLSVITPVSGQGWSNHFELPGSPPLSERERLVFMNGISPGWFDTYGSRLRAGRDFDARDVAGAQPVAIVNEAFGRKFSPGASVLGRRLSRQGSPQNPPPDVVVVGVVEDSVYRRPREPLPPIVYLPRAQASPPGTSVTLSVRAARGNPVLLVKSVAAAIGGVNRDLSLTFRPLTALVDAALVGERILAMLSGFFGALALLLAAIGLYGVTAYSVSRRRTEIGIRMALGANARGVVRLVVRRVAVMVALGIVLGAAASLWASRLVGSLLHGLPPRDPATFLGAALVLAAIAALATWLPARRAARIDPAQVLREG